MKIQHLNLYKLINKVGMKFDSSVKRKQNVFLNKIEAPEEDEKVKI